MRHLLRLFVIALCAVSLRAQAVTGLQDATVRYVSSTGSDANAGSSWQAAKATVGAAIGSLPQTPWYPNNRYGTIYVGPGTFMETATPIEFSGQIHLVCASSGDGSSGQGSVIKLGSGRNTSLLSYTAAFAAANGYAHFLQVDNCTFDGNSQSNPAGSAGLVRVYNGGFGNTFRNVTFQNATGFALDIENQAVNFSCYTCSFGGIYGNGGAVYVNDLAGGNVVLFVDTQIDNSGASPIVINQASSDTGSSNQFTFINLKTEASLGLATHQHVITFSPRPTPYGNPVNITVNGLTSVDTIGTGDAVLYEASQPGAGANWMVSSVSSVNYPKAFRSDKTGQVSVGSYIRTLSASDTSLAYSYAPEMEFSGGAGVLVGHGSPQGIVSGKVGTLYLRLDGSPGATLYVKESGTSTTGWAAK